MIENLILYSNVVGLIGCVFAWMLWIMCTVFGVVAKIVYIWGVALIVDAYDVSKDDFTC